MNYDKKTAKHYALLSSDEYVKSLDTYKAQGDLFGISALLNACCNHYFAAGKPAFYADKAKDCIINILAQKNSTTNNYLQYDCYGKAEALSALISYNKMTGDESIFLFADHIADELLAEFDALLSSDEQPDITKAFYLRPLAMYYFSREKRPEIIDAAKWFLSFYINPKAVNAPSESIINGAIGLLLLSDNVKELQKGATEFASFFIKNNNSAIFSCGQNFLSCDLSDPFATSLLLLFYTSLYKKTGNALYSHYSRRIWFNALQFCQRENGGVGYDSFVSVNQPILQVKSYYEKRLTPLYADALYAYEKNKAVFMEEDGEVKKDSLGRYFISDKIFSRDESEFFGRDLIEIPSLTSFDKETALQLRLKTIF